MDTPARRAAQRQLISKLRHRLWRGMAMKLALRWLCGIATLPQQRFVRFWAWHLWKRAWVCGFYLIARGDVEFAKKISRDYEQLWEGNLMDLVGELYNDEI